MYIYIYTYTYTYPMKSPCFPGLILRDYLVLCHGWTPSRIIATAVSWNPGTMAPSRAGRGKPSGSRVQCLGMGCLVRNQQGMSECPSGKLSILC